MSEEWQVDCLAPFGAMVTADLSQPLTVEAEQNFRALFAQHKLLLFRDQKLNETEQVQLIGALGAVLGSRGEYREISSDGNLGAGPLAYHSDLAFTPEPFKILSLHAVEVNDGESWTSFASGIEAVRRMEPALRTRVKGYEALTVISVVQSHREVDFDPPAFLPQQSRPAIIAHPTTGEPVLYISEMQTARIEGLDQPGSDAALSELFSELYAPANVYRHYWRNGDLIVWDNIALQHARCDLTGMHPRRLQRIAVADKSFFDLCPQFDLSDPRLAAWAAGQKLQVT